MMMKKSRWMMLLAALICLSMLFASCGSGVTDAPDEETPNGPADSNGGKTPGDDDPTVDDGPGNETVIYRAITDEWSKYLAYKAPEVESAKTATLLAKDNGDNWRVERHGTFLRQTKLVNENTTEAPTYREYTTCVYSVITGEAVTDEYRYLVYNDATRPELSYSFDYSDAIVEVRTATLTEVEGGAEEYVYTYDYYTHDGEKLNETALEESSFDWTWNGDYCYTYVEDTCYISEDGVIIKTYANGKEVQPIGFDVVCGDFGYISDGGIYSIFDLNGKLLTSYVASGAYTNYNYDYLSNGNMLFRYVRECNAEESRYTVEDEYGEKWLYSYVIVDAATGTAKEIPVEFVIDRMVTKAQDMSTNLTLKGDYQYAEITKIKDGSLEATSIPVILDNNLKIVAELPLILKNQTSFVEAISQSFWIVAVDVFGTRCYYSVDLSTGKVALYYDMRETYTYRAVDGGFLYDKVLYNDLMVQLLDLSEATGIEAFGNGKLLVTTSVGDTVQKKLVYIENGQVKSTVLCDGNDGLDEWYGLIRIAEYDSLGSFKGYVYRNEKGELLLSGQRVYLEQSFDGTYLMRVKDENGVDSYYSVR